MSIRVEERRALLRELIKLGFDAADACEAAADTVDNGAAELRSFAADHERHIAELIPAFERAGGGAGVMAEANSLVRRGKAIVGSLLGDAGVLLAVKTHEDALRTAYMRAEADPATPVEVCSVLRRALVDQHRHREWIDRRMGNLPGSEAILAEDPEDRPSAPSRA